MKWIRIKFPTICEMVRKKGLKGKKLHVHQLSGEKIKIESKNQNM